MANRGWRFGGQVLLILSVAVVAQLGALAVNVFSSQDSAWPGVLDLIRRHPFAAGLLLTAALGLAGVLQFWMQERAAAADGPARPTVPRPPDWVVRRPAEVGRARRALRRKGEDGRGPVVVLHGSGGFGKTTLAGLVCADRRVARRFRGGVYRVVLGRDVEGRAVVAARVNELVELITGNRPGYEDPDLAGQHLGRVLDGRRRVLIVVDDVWNERQAAPFLVGGRRAARLLTSRVPAESFAGSTGVLVDDLPEPDARTVLTWRLPELPPDTVDDLLDVGARWALLVRLINRVLAEQIETGRDPVEAAAELIARLRSDGPGAVDSWTGPAIGDADDPELRSRAVRTTIEAAGGLLPPGGLDRLAELTVFTEDESVPLPLIARLWTATAGMEETQARGLCRQLSRLSLISLSPGSGGTMTMHDTIRAYLRAGLDDDRLRDLHATLLDASGTVTGWWGLGEDDRYLWENLVRHLLEAGRAGEAARLVTDLRWVIARLRWTGPVGALADLDACGSGERADVLRAELARWTHLLSPTDPPEAVQDVLLARLQDVPGWADEVRDVIVALDGPRLIARAPLPDRPDPALRQTLTGHDGSVKAVVIAPDGSWLASAGSDGTVRIWDAATGVERACFRDLGRAAVALAVSRDGALLAAASHVRVQVWDVASGQALRSRKAWPGVLARFYDVSFDASRILAIATDGTVLRWDVETGRTRKQPPQQTSGSAAVTFSGDGAFLAEAWNRKLTSQRKFSGVPREGRVRIWDMSGRQVDKELNGHLGTVSAVAVAPDGSWLVSVGADRAIRLWDRRSGECRHVLTGHLGDISSVDVDPTGTWLASSGDDRTVRLWDVDTGDLVATLRGHTDEVSGVAIAPDGVWLASASRDGTVRIWDAHADRSYVRHVAAGPKRFSWRVGTARMHADVAADPCGGWVAVLGGKKIVIMDVAQWTVVERLGGHRWGADVLTVAPDGRWLASAANADHTLILWDTGTWERLASIDIAGTPVTMAAGPGGDWIAIALGWCVRVIDVPAGRSIAEISHVGARALAVPYDGSWLATAGEDGTIRIWDPATGAARRAFVGHTGRVHALAAAPDGSWLASAGDDAIVMMWDAATGELKRTFTGTAEQLHALAVAPDGSWLAAAGDDGVIQIWDAATAALCAAFVSVSRDTVLQRRILGLAVPADGGWIAGVALRHGQVWDTAPIAAQLTRAAARANEETGAEHAPAAVAVAPDGTWLATGGADGTLRIRASGTGETTTLTGHTDRVTAVAVAPDGTWAATVGADRTVRLWDPRSGELSRTFTTEPTGFTQPVRLRARAWECLRLLGRRILIPQWSVHAVAISPDGAWVAWVGGDHALRIWDAAADTVHKHPTGSLRTLRALAIAPDGAWLAYAGNDRAVRIWDVATKTVRLTLRGHRAPVQSLAASPDGTLLVSAGDDRQIRVWDASTGQAVRVLDQHKAPIRAIAVSPDWRLASADTTGCLRVVDLRTGDPVAMMRFDGGLDDCAWSDDGALLAAVGSRGLVLLELRV